MQHPTSDVDIGVRPSLGHRLTDRDRVRLAIALEDLFDVSRIDLVVLPEADPFLALNVIRGELLYCTDPDAQAEYERKSAKRNSGLQFTICLSDCGCDVAQGKLYQIRPFYRRRIRQHRIIKQNNHGVRFSGDS